MSPPPGRQTLLSRGFAARQMQIPPSRRAEVKPQQERRRPPPGTETRCGGGGKWGHGLGWGALPGDFWE